MRLFETGAVRDSTKGKPIIDCLKGYTRQRFGYHMAIGAEKYGRNNWEKGMPDESYLESLDRHLAAFMDGDRSEDHLSAIIFGCQGLMMNEKARGVKSNYYYDLVTSKPLEKKSELPKEVTSGTAQKYIPPVSGGIKI
jgi:hypothetical protein